MIDVTWRNPLSDVAVGKGFCVVDIEGDGEKQEEREKQRIGFDIWIYFCG